MATTTDTSDGSLGVLNEAREMLRVERRRVVDEREAFRAFHGRIGSIPSETVRPIGGDGTSPRGVRGSQGGPTGMAGSPTPTGRTGSPVPTGSSARPGSGLVAVRNAYEETVMSVPHYEIEYDNTYERSVAAEFGPELAYALTRTSRFHEEYKRSLLDAVDTAIEERARFLTPIRNEMESVERAASRLSPIDREIETTVRRELPKAEFGALDACRNRTTALLEDCDRIAARRQRVIAEHERELSLDDDLDLPTYLYADLSVDYPALAAVGAVGDRLAALKRRIERAMADAE